MGFAYLPAAAIPEGATVVLPNDKQMTIDHVENGAPLPGKVTWRDGGPVEVVIGASIPVKVIKLP